MPSIAEIIYKSIDTQSVTAGTGITVWNPASGKRFVLKGWRIATDQNTPIIWASNVPGSVIGMTPRLQGIDHDTAENIGSGIRGLAVDHNLILDVKVTGNVAGTVWGTEEE